VDQGILMVTLLFLIAAAIAFFGAVFTAAAFYEFWHALELMETRHENN